MGFGTVLFMNMKECTKIGISIKDKCVYLYFTNGCIYIVVVEVGYNESSYTLSEANGYVEVCVNATSPGISEEFYIYSTSAEMIGECTNYIRLLFQCSLSLSFLRLVWFCYQFFKHTKLCCECQSSI